VTQRGERWVAYGLLAFAALVVLGSVAVVLVLFWP
jgi:hypothetical protein